MVSMKNHLNVCFAWTTHETLLCKAYFHGIFTPGLPFSPNSTNFMSFSWKHTKMVVFRGLGRKMPISGGKWCEYHQFGAVIACPNAMAAPGTILHPETPKNHHFNYFNRVLVISTKMIVLLVFRGEKWAPLRPSRLDKLLLCQIGSYSTTCPPKWAFPSPNPWKSSF